MNTDRERVRTYRKKKKGCDMVFNTGAALLDDIVLAVVSREKESPAASSFKFRYILRFPLELLLRKTSKRRRTDALSLNECPLIF